MQPRDQGVNANAAVELGYLRAQGAPSSVFRLPPSQLCEGSDGHGLLQGFRWTRR